MQKQLFYRCFMSLVSREQRKLEVQTVKNKMRRTMLRCKKDSKRGVDKTHIEDIRDFYWNIQQPG